MLQAVAGSFIKLYVDDVFSAYTYTGNGSTQSIVNGIDLAGKGGMVWTKKRGVGIGDHHTYDTHRGATFRLIPNATNGQIETLTGLTAFNSTGFSIGAYSEVNGTGDPQVSWTFRKAPKFFDVVTYTGDGAATKVINHSLGQTPGMVIIKITSTTGTWYVYHRSLGNFVMALNTTGAASSGAVSDGAPWTSTTFTVINSDLGYNANGATYVVYFFAHDTSAEGLIQCGSFTTDASGNATVNLGWEPQFIVEKDTGAVDPWRMYDSSRGLVATGSGSLTQRLIPNDSSAEGPAGDFKVTATGFVASLNASRTYIYLAIRRPNKPPTVGTQVYNAVSRTGTDANATISTVGFAPDLLLVKNRSGTASPIGNGTLDRLRGLNNFLTTSGTGAEDTAQTDIVRSYNMDGVTLGPDLNTSRFNWSGNTYINHFFKRAPGVFDEVCYTGTGVAKTEAHNLGAVPELMIFKRRNLGSNWSVYSASLGNNKAVRIQGTDAAYNAFNEWSSTSPTASVFTVDSTGGNDTNASGSTYVAYLFATKAGISKIGNFTGNGGTQTIACGFTTGARFVLIKCTSAVGDWFVWDTVRGVIAGNDPHLSLNTTAAEVTTDDSIDPDTSGFIVNQDAATGINVAGATYIFLAIA